ncbi:protein AUXIN RESPONSE 4 isoform X2 [Iris pallida]|uniref:Protein AUXIN RESPONSE 4 isoform X2 n=1 Tax=Iris pallida TaxID=29817 RepID=A0AAX6I1D7_IRIPA|nr:protein AUXIN RESPONSE 4 isoform X2 [Iris pallida]
MRENGVFQAFDRLVETGEIPSRADAGGFEDSGFFVGKALDEMSIRRPVHLVLHDSSLAVSPNWVSANARRVQSVTLVDTPCCRASGVPFPVPPGAGFRKPASEVGVYVCRVAEDVLLAETAQRRIGFLSGTTTGRGWSWRTGKGLNRSFDLGEWASSEDVKGIPMQVLWSSMLSDRRRAASVCRGPAGAFCLAFWREVASGRRHRRDYSIDCSVCVISTKIHKTDRGGSFAGSHRTGAS